MVTEFAGQVKGEQAKAQTMVAEMQRPERFSLSPENLQQAKELQAVAQTSLGKLTGIEEGLTPFITQWQNQGNEVEALTSGLESGALPADVATQISNVQTNLEGASTQLNEWKSTYQEATSGYTAAYESFMALLPESNEMDK
jgi:hypothetical protein